MPKPAAPAASLALYEALVATQPGLERKGATMPYTSIDGNMFSFLTPDGTLALRLPELEREDFLRRHRTQLCVQYGVVMKEYVAVPPALLARTKELVASFATSYRYAKSLKPKATTRAKSSGASKQPARKPKSTTRSASDGAKSSSSAKAKSKPRAKRS